MNKLAAGRPAGRAGHLRGQVPVSSAELHLRQAGGGFGRFRSKPCGCAVAPREGEGPLWRTGPQGARVWELAKAPLPPAHLPLVGVKNLHPMPAALPPPWASASPTVPSLPAPVLGCGNWGRGVCVGIRYCSLGRWVSAAWGSPGAQTLTGSSLSNLGVPPGRGNCPLTVPLPFDLIYTDYHGLQQMRQHMGLSFRKYR